MSRWIAFAAISPFLEGWPLCMRMLQVAALAWVPSQVIWVTVSMFYPGPSLHDPFGSSLQVLNTIAFAPVFETILMWGLFSVLRKFSLRTSVLAAISSLIWGAAHVRTQAWGLHAVWSFGVMGICFLNLALVSTHKALLVTAIIHSIFNGWSYVVHLALLQVNRLQL